MPLDRSRDYGTSCGGPTNGFAVQDGKIYDHDGDEVDENGVPVKPASAAHTTAVAKKEPATPETARAILADAENPDADEKSEVREASDWLRDRIEEAGGLMAKREIIHEAQQAGFAGRTIQRAKKPAGVITCQTGFGDAKQSMWMLGRRATSQHGREYQWLANHDYWGAEYDAFRCGARTRAGAPCKLRPIYPSGRCRFHGGLSTGPTTEQGRRQSAENGRKGGRPRKRPVESETKH